jgi:hydantoinase/carbamoylase family amidase
MKRVDELASVSDDPICITRTYGSPAFLAGRQMVLRWMNEAGLHTRIDQVGNLRARLDSKVPGAKTFLVGSHIDTVVNAGRFDGPLGVIMGIDLLQQLQLDETPMPFNIELIAFCDEEGVRFHTTFLGSMSVAGLLQPAMLVKADAGGINVWEAIIAMGGDPERLHEDAFDPGCLLGYFEIHIEQGPVLYDSGLPAAFVKAIAGQSRIEVSFKGEAGHAGTVPMTKRKDALCAAAEFILGAEEFAKTNEHALVATVGTVKTLHASSNVIPGEVVCSLDVRNENEDILESSTLVLQQLAGAIGKRRNIDIRWKVVNNTKPVHCDVQLSQLLDQSIREAGFQSVELVSGAGHDAVPLSCISPVCMMFVRCFKGISHHPLENVELNDLRAALQIADIFIHRLIEKHPF